MQYTFLSFQYDSTINTFPRMLKNLEAFKKNKLLEVFKVLENMDMESAPLDGSSYTFDPRKIDAKAFLEGQDNPGKDFSVTVIRDVIGDLQKDFQQDGVPKEVLELLERSWLTKLKIGPLEHYKPSQSKSVVRKILQFDGLEDNSSSSDDEVEVIDKSDSTEDDDTDGQVNFENDQYDASDELVQDDSLGSLGSEDDIFDDVDDISKVKNVVFCQYDKIWKSGGKQKFVLKDGVMNLNGEDHVFKKAYGEAEDVNQ